MSPFGRSPIPFSDYMLIWFFLIILGPSILNLDIEQLSSNKAVLQSLVNFSCSAIQENKHFPNSSELMERFKFLRDQLPIVIPDGFITKAVVSNNYIITS